MIVSANHVAVMLAEAAGGSVPRFARAMDAESRVMGLRGSSWRNPNGLDAPGLRSTAFDLAILARAVLRDPWLAKLVRKRHAAFVTPSGRHHTLTSRSRFLLSYRGAVGIKTRFTDDAGHRLAPPPGGGRTLIRPAGVAALLTRPPAAVERHRPTVPGAMASTGLARVGATPAPRPAGSPARVVQGGTPACGHRHRGRARPPGGGRARCPQTSPTGLTPGPR